MLNLFKRLYMPNLYDTQNSQSYVEKISIYFKNFKKEKVYEIIIIL